MTTTFPLDFAPFAEGQTLTLAPITVLLGYNNVGKTTILKHVHRRLKALFAETAFIMPTSSYVLFEQPEKGLHPVKHADIAEHLVIKAFESEKKIIVETHSQNFVLRLRVLIAEGMLLPEMLSLNFVEIGEGGKSYIRKINVNADGTVSDWIKGFFNETLQETSRLRDVQINKTHA